MPNTPAHPGPFDPLVNADPDVPFFALMGTDPLAPELVLEWADRARRHARGLDEEKARRHLLAKCNEAEEIAWAMQRYLKTGTAEETRAKPTRATYSGAGTPDEDHERKELLAYATQSLREAAYYASEGHEALVKLALCFPEEDVLLKGALEAINKVADAHTPKRALAGEAQA